MSAAAACGPSLGDMPAEMIDLVVACLPRVRDIVAFYTALCRHPTHALVGRALADPRPFLHRGAPLDFVQALADGRGLPVPFCWLKAAVVGGRRDVVAWLHGVADGVDRLEDVDVFARTPVSSRRRKRAIGQPRCLMASACARGHVHVLRWLLDVYSAPRFAAMPICDQSTVDYLCDQTLASEGHTVAIIDALHRHCLRAPCACPWYSGYVALRADRADVLAWMCDSGCMARLDPDDPETASDMIQDAVDAGSASVIRWMGPRANCRLMAECIAWDVLASGRPQARRRAVDLVVRAGLFWPCMAWACPAVLLVGFRVVGRWVDRRVGADTVNALACVAVCPMSLAALCLLASRLLPTVFSA
ncbi:hypothetical protein psal_cds_1026 [Pandoravirus salinus]|uniref:Ankyrin repeat domain containing protein n=1 Tax=Pandoravirus salinus TaxID=1349410 RepID=S4W3I3_9VIRU|nr:hypothetical protein psal_cds_1026 [Pandoravirus salinus]AGO85212.1 hypothetical protein psal_cds_1026 [Pandoravirus salinus]